MASSVHKIKHGNRFDLKREMTKEWRNAHNEEHFLYSDDQIEGGK
jgi:hypothetical protein